MRIRTARMKYDIETEEEAEKRRVNMKLSTAGRKKDVPTGITVARAYRPPEALTRLVMRRAVLPSVTEMRAAKSYCGVHTGR